MPCLQAALAFSMRFPAGGLFPRFRNPSVLGVRVCHMLGSALARRIRGSGGGAALFLLVYRRIRSAPPSLVAFAVFLSFILEGALGVVMLFPKARFFDAAVTVCVFPPCDPDSKRISLRFREA
jgi:hypothetical protein